MALRLPPRRVIPAAALLVAVAACTTVGARALARSSSTDATHRSGSVVEYRSAFFAFRHPSGWKTFEFPGSFHFNPLVYVSTQPGHDPCRKSDSSTTVCGWPIDRLRPNGVLIVWENRGFPGGSFASVPGKALRVGGRSAKSATTRPGRCSAIGADETVDVAIQLPARENWTEMTACLRGPDLSAREREIRALLASTSFVR